MSNLNVITTDAGRAAILAADSAGLDVSITHVAAGSSAYNPEDRRNATALLDERERVEIVSSRVVADQYRLDINALFFGESEYWVREVGFFDSEGALVWLWSSPTETLGYKSAPVRFLLGLSLTIVDVPLDAITIIDQGQPLELSLALIEEDLAGTHPAGESHNYAGTDWRETDWLAQSGEWERQAELIRAMGQSGIVNSRQYEEAGTEAWNRAIDGSYGAINIHNHPNYPAMCGIAELSAALNGHYVRTRHNDYRLRQAISGDYLETEAVPMAGVPSSVTSQSTVTDQVTEMRTYFQAMATGNVGLRDYRSYFRWTLSTLEVWPEILPADRTFNETFLSFRHEEIASEQRAQLALLLERCATGYKGKLENLSVIPGSLRQVNVNGAPAWVIWRYRISSTDVGSVGDYPTEQLLTLADRQTYRWHSGRRLHELPETRQARFSVNRALASDRYDGKYTGLDLLDTMMGKVPGLDGAGANIAEVYTDEGETVTIKKYGDTENLNAGYYSRRYGMVPGASNRTKLMRGWNDPTLFAALNTRPEVYAVANGERSYRVSYAIPLELILRTPLEGWNPYGLPKIADETTMTGAGTSGNPYLGYREKAFYYLTPDSFFSGSASGTDPADTDVGTVYVRDSGGTARAVRASGLYVHLPSITGISPDVRLRYPIYPLWHEGHPAYTSAMAMMGDTADAIMALSNTITDQHERIKALQQSVDTAHGRLNQVERAL